jgi:hypothetical protein
MLLLSRALDQFGGAVETTFEPTGLICKLSIALQKTAQVSRPTKHARPQSDQSAVEAASEWPEQMSAYGPSRK